MTKDEALLESLKSRMEFFKHIATIESGFFLVIIFILGLIKEFTAILDVIKYAVLFSTFPTLTLIFALTGIMRCSNTIEELGGDRKEIEKSIQKIKIESTNVIVFFVVSKLVLAAVVALVAEGVLLVN